MEVSCAFAREAYSAGGLFTVILRGRGVPLDCVVLVQGQGHLQADPRWVKVPAGLFESSPAAGAAAAVAGFPLDVSVHTPRPPAPLQAAAPLVFVTPREALSPSSLLEPDGVVVQFDLPSDVLPTFRGLCSSTSYNLAVTLQPAAPDAQPSTLFFPFTVLSRGSAGQSPFVARFSPLSVFATSSLPPDNVLVPTQTGSGGGGGGGGDDDDDDDEFGDSGHEQPLGHAHRAGAEPAAYKISNRGPICTLTLVRSDLRGRLLGGSVLAANLDFSASAFASAFAFASASAEQGKGQGQGQGQAAAERCTAVRARLLQCETRLDGSRVQERCLASAARVTTDCLSCSLQLTVPPASPCDGVTPLFRLTHSLEVSFSLTSEAPDSTSGGEEDEPEEPLTLTLPMSLDLPYPASNSAVECNRALDAGLVVVETSW